MSAEASKELGGMVNDLVDITSELDGWLTAGDDEQTANVEIADMKALRSLAYTVMSLIEYLQEKNI